MTRTVSASRSIEVILPGGRHTMVNIKGGSLGGRRAGSWATTIAKEAGLAIGRKRWQLRGPLGVIHPQMLVRNLDLQIGECLTLEEHP